jgi:signal transduction histidine kinase
MIKRLLFELDPRRSLVAATTWLVIALAASFALAASIWVGRVAREIVVQQHVRRLVLETDQLASDLGQAVAARQDALRAIARLVPPQDAYRQLQLAYPDMGWFMLADASGRIVAADHTDPDGAESPPPAWITQGLRGPWLGLIDTATAAEPGALGDLALPLTDAEGRTVAVAAAHLHWPALAGEIRRLSTAVDPGGSAQTLVLDGAGRVLIGPAELRGRRWSGVVEDEAAGPGNTQFERLPDGSSVLVARATVGAAVPKGEPAWQLQLSEGRPFVYQRADALANRILWISVVLGVLTALIGALGARKLTRRLRRLAQSAAAVGRNAAAVIEVPSGHDEVAQLAAGFARILDDLRLERSELLKLSGDLERRVDARTREVERLAAESRYSALVRERLKIARDLHDTLAHSMMAMLSEVRLLRKLQAHDPAALAEELERAEKVARDGLNEARTAIAQMRVNAVRDTGLGSALAAAFERFIDRTGIAGDYAADPEAASFGDVRAETVFRMAEEALRNIERHAHASRVALRLQVVGATHLRLRIEDDGVGFDPSVPHPGHFGLVGLREQAQLIDADLRIDSAAGQGTAVSITVRIAPVMV